ncbi:MAG: family 10 glycosylhydrolase [Oscillochloris sp.]|nr:family 10 glycosylhydrolase [Oscillochloris sp.]
MRAFGLLLTFALLLTVVPPASTRAQDVPQQLRAFWVDNLNPGIFNHPQVDELVENVVRANANTIIVEVRRHGDAWFNNRIEPRAGDPRLAPESEFDPLEYLLARAHQSGIKVHAWLVMSVACRPSDPLWGHPEHLCTSHGPNAQGAERWTTATHSGTQIGDIDFGHPAAVQHLERVVQHLLNAYPTLDGLHWDYIRYGGADYGYNQVSLDRFNQAVGRAVGSRPAPDDPAWSQWRRDRVTETVRRLYIRAKAIKPTVQISAATITWGGVGSYYPGDWPNSAAYSRVFQDWPAWLSEGIIDFAVPMHYFDESVPRSRDWYDGWLRFDREHVGRRAIVVGLGSWLNDSWENQSQIERALAPDAYGRALAGVAFFSYNQPIAGSNRERRREFMDHLRGTVFAGHVVAPVWPWIAAPTAGHLQGIAAVAGQIVPGAKITIIHEGQWLYDISAGTDGWYGAVELPPGSYTIVVTAADGRQQAYPTVITPGLVTSL